ncbi:MAG TPA: NIPSNAP family protein [Sphingomicrobium sp.]|nr:NIPSNAP family protein [Sphingomicrobium sp.]HKS17997.1 NIPSNAP family protein [Bradyrhizobium sp.]
MSDSQRDGSKTVIATASPVIELRQYTLYPGTRDTFVELFDRELIEPQEAEGIRVIGQFRDIGDPNRFVWLRGFADMPSREKALTNFYFHAPAWKAHSEAARLAVIDSTDALLLRPPAVKYAFSLPPSDQRSSIDSELPEGIVVASVYSLRAPADGELLEFFERDVTPILEQVGGAVLGAFVTDPSPNNFARSPLREGENVFCSFWGFRDLAHYHEYVAALGSDQRWRTETFPELMRRIAGRPHTMRLTPTSRSQLRF